MHSAERMPYGSTKSQLPKFETKSFWLFEIGIWGREWFQTVPYRDFPACR